MVHNYLNEGHFVNIIDRSIERLVETAFLLQITIYRENWKSTILSIMLFLYSVMHNMGDITRVWFEEMLKRLAHYEFIANKNGYHPICTIPVLNIFLDYNMENYDLSDNMS